MDPLFRETGPEIGTVFPDISTPANTGEYDMTTNELLDRVLEVEAFVASCRVDDPGQAPWTRKQGSTKPGKHNLYHGSAGVALFYLELHRATGTERFLEEAVRAGDEIATHLQATDTVSIGIYTGLPSYIFVLNELAKAGGHARFRKAAVEAVERMGHQAIEIGSGIGWIEPAPFSRPSAGDREVLDLSVGAAGAGIGLLYAHRQGLHADALQWACQAADRLLETNIDTEHGPNWLMMMDMPFPFTAPNFAHGASGVGYFMADLYRATEDQKYLDTAIAAAGYVKAHATPSGDGHLVLHTKENPGLFYLGVCHGPPGTNRLMLLLNEITGDAEWAQWADGNVDGFVATGAPEVRSEGFWQNYGQCCGDAGVGDYAVSVHRSTGKAGYLELAQRIADSVVASSEFADGKRWWVQAEHRTKPDFVEAQTGFMQGAAGIGSFLLHLATVDAPVVSKIPMPDSPFSS